MKRLDDRIVVVTGASSGFGRATAVRLAEEGAHVLVADLDAVRGEESVSLVEEAGGKGALVIADVGTAEGADAVVSGALDRFGTIDVLVNNAGIVAQPRPDSWDASEEDWDRVLRVNLKSVYLCSRRVIPVFLEQGGGSIVNVASIAATRAVGGAAYSASKAGILGYTVRVASELAASGIRVNCVSPGFMRSPMTTGERDGLSAEEQDARVQGFGEHLPMGSMGSAHDIAAAVAYLASDDARYVTGQEIVVDGGYLVAGSSMAYLTPSDPIARP